MRLAIVATVAAGSSAFLHQKTVAHKPSEKDVASQKAELVAEENAFRKQKADLEKKLKAVGLYDMLHGSSHQQESQKMAVAIKEAKEKGEKRSRDMSHEDALKVLEGKLPDVENHKLAMLVKKAEAGKKDEEEKLLFVRAMTVLNEMYLTAEDERTMLVTQCHSDLFEMFRRLFLTWNNIFSIAADATDAWAEGNKADEERQEALKKEAKVKEEGDITLAQQSVYVYQEEEVLVAREADSSLYRFILQQIDKSCVPPAPALLMQTGKAVGAAGMDDKAAKCHEKCAAEGQPVVDSAILHVLSDPRVQEEAKKSLDEHAQMSMKKTLGILHRNEKEKVHPKYTSFLQVSGHKASYAPHLITDGSGCGCSPTSMSCETMMTLIGQELECAKQLELQQGGVVTEKKSDEKDEKDKINDASTSIRMTVELKNELILNAIGKLKNLRTPFYQQIWELIAIWHGLWEKRWKCMVRLDDIETNTYCALKHIRGYMRDLTLEAWKFKPTDVVDCAMDDLLTPTGMCMFDGQDAEVTCIEGDFLPADADLMPKQEWTRSEVVVDNTTDAAQAAMGNTTFALACPSTQSVMLKCNMFLCARDCAISEWGGWTPCTADCDQGFQQRTAAVIMAARNGGKRCPPQTESQKCNEEACDADCELHEAWVLEDCLHACATPCATSDSEVCTEDEETGLEQRPQIKRKHIAKEAKGRGECPDKDHESRLGVQSCEGEAKQCQGDEVCQDIMDLVIAYECSVATGKLGCWFFASFVVSLMGKMPAAIAGGATMRLGLVKFGNGMSVKVPGKNKYTVSQSDEIASITGDFDQMITNIYNDAVETWRDAEHWHLGFNNIGQAVSMGTTMLEGSDRNREGGNDADKRLLVLTKGKRAGCTVVKSVGEELRGKGYTLQIVLFSDAPASAKEFEALQEAVGDPWEYYLLRPGSSGQLADWGFRGAAARSLIPKICPNAGSSELIFEKMCDVRVRLLHRARTCHDWTFALVDGATTLDKCRNAAFEKGFTGFVFTESGAKSVDANCFSHEIDGKKPQYDVENGRPYENTCNYCPDYGASECDIYTGWFHQSSAASADQKITDHFAVLESKDECLHPWNNEEKQLFLGKNWGGGEEINQYFDGVKIDDDVDLDVKAEEDARKAMSKEEDSQ